jgi:hypothetical protein
MKTRISFVQLNKEYSEEFALANHEGKESTDNPKYLWEDEVKTTNDIKDVKFKENSVYELKGSMSDGNTFSFDIPNMRIISLIGSDGVATDLGISESILDSIEKIEEEGKYIFYIKDKTVFNTPFMGLYIEIDDLPKELKV